MTFWATLPKKAEEEDGPITVATLNFPERRSLGEIIGYQERPIALKTSEEIGPTGPGLTHYKPKDKSIYETYSPVLYIRNHKWFRKMIPDVETREDTEEKEEETAISDAHGLDRRIKEGNQACLFHEISRIRAMDQLIVALIDPHDHYLFTVFDNFLTFNDYQKTFLETNRTFFEVILGERCQKPHFDIDIAPSHLLPGHTLEMAGQIVLDQLVFHLLAIYPEISITQDVLLYNSSNDQKISFHLVVNHHYHLNHLEAKELYLQILQRYDEDVPYKDRIDHAVYGSSQQFRILGSRKRGTNRPKLFQRNWIYRGELIQHEYEEEPDDLGYEEILQLKESLITYTGESRLLSFLRPDSASTVNNHYGNHRPDDLSPELAQLALELLATVSQISLKDPRFPFTLKKISGNEVRLKRNKPSRCSLCKRVHENDNPRLLVRGSGPVRTVFYDCRRNPQNATRLLGNIDDPECLKEYQVKVQQEAEWATQLCTDVIGALERVGGKEAVAISTQAQLDEAMARVAERMNRNWDEPTEMIRPIRLTRTDKTAQAMNWEDGEEQTQLPEEPEKNLTPKKPVRLTRKPPVRAPTEKGIAAEKKDRAHLTEEQIQRVARSVKWDQPESPTTRGKPAARDDQLNRMATKMDWDDEPRPKAKAKPKPRPSPRSR